MSQNELKAGLAKALKQAVETITEMQKREAAGKAALEAKELKKTLNAERPGSVGQTGNESLNAIPTGEMTKAVGGVLPEVGSMGGSDTSAVGGNDDTCKAEACMEKGEMCEGCGGKIVSVGKTKKAEHGLCKKCGTSYSKEGLGKAEYISDKYPSDPEKRHVDPGKVKGSVPGDKPVKEISASGAGGEIKKAEEELEKGLRDRLKSIEGVPEIAAAAGLFGLPLAGAMVSPPHAYHAANPPAITAPASKVASSGATAPSPDTGPGFEEMKAAHEKRMKQQKIHSSNVELAVKASKGKGRDHYERMLAHYEKINPSGFATPAPGVHKKEDTELSPKQKEKASEFISEEVKTGKYPHDQAVAIGISRAKQTKKMEKTIFDMLKRKKAELKDPAQLPGAESPHAAVDQANKELAGFQSVVDAPVAAATTLPGLKVKKDETPLTAMPKAPKVSDKFTPKGGAAAPSAPKVPAQPEAPKPPKAG